MEIAVFQFNLISIDELLLPRYKGSTFRGVLGHALKKTVCITGMSSCDNCIVSRQCTYANIFEPANQRKEKIARPFIIEPPLTEKRIFPAININRSGTRKEEYLTDPEELQKMWVLRKVLHPMDELAAVEFLLNKLQDTKTNAQFFEAMKR